MARSSTWWWLLVGGVVASGAAGVSRSGVTVRPVEPRLAPAPWLATAAALQHASVVRTFQLGREAPRQRELPAGTIDAYEIDLRTDQYLYFKVEQRGVDVFIDVFAPGRRRLFRADSPTGSRGLEPVHLVADEPGRYRLEVAAVKAGSHGLYLARIGALRQVAPVDRDRAVAQQTTAQAQDLAGRPEAFWEAAARYEKALRLWQAAGDLAPQVVVLHDLGRLYFDHGKSADALDLFRRSLVLCRKLRQSHDEAIALNEAGRAYGSLGDYSGARQAFASALTIWRSRGERPEIVSTLINLGILEQTHDRSWQALATFREAKDLAHQAGLIRSEVNALNGMGWAYASAADWQRAREAHLQALGLLNRSADRPLRTATLTQLGNACLGAGELQQALLYFGRALALEGDAGSAHERAVTLDSMGRCFQEQGANREALDAFAKALAIFEPESSEREAADARINIGRSLSSLGRQEEALAQFGEALRLARKVQDRGLQAAALLGTAAAERARGNLIRARADGEAALQIVEALRAEAVRPDLETSYLAWHGESYFDLMVETLMALHLRQPGGGFAYRAFERSEQSRSRRLADALATRSELPADHGTAGRALFTRWSRLDAEIDAQDLARRRPGISATEAAAAEHVLSSLLEELNELLVAQGRRAPHAATGAAPLGAVQRLGLLDSGTILLEYYLAEPRSFLWAVSPGGRVQSFEIPGRATIEARVRSLYNLLSGRDPRVANEPEAARAAAERESLELSRILLGQVATSLGRRRLAIAASGALEFLPFAALPELVGPPGPLVRSHEIVYVPSLAVLAELRRRATERQPPRGLVAIVADPVFGPSDPRLRGTPIFRPRRAPDELPRLPDSATEAAAILALARTEPVLEKTGLAATREVVTSGALSGYRILHLATHGTTLVDHPELSSIVLSLFDGQGRPRDGYLRAKDLARLELPADLVVLSACSTAIGPEIAREGMFGLPQSFLAAGARRALVSLWNVSDRTTAELMARFYRHLLAEHLLPADALRRAQVEISQQARWHDPYHWAAFVLQGDWQ